VKLKCGCGVLVVVAADMGAMVHMPVGRVVAVVIKRCFFALLLDHIV